MALFGWKYKKAITIDNSNNPNTLTDYQVLVVLDTASLISAGKMNSDGSDIRITDSNGSTLLNYWVEGINTSSTKIWVKVPTIPASSTKTIYLYYGNPNATSQSSIANTFIREISGLVGAWSLDEGTGTTTADSSGNNNTGTLYNGTAWTNSGKFNKALSFDGVDDYVLIPASSSLMPTQFSIEAWVKLTDKANFYMIVSKRNAAGSIMPYELLYHKTLDRFHFQIYSSGSWYIATDTISPVQGVWYHLIGVYNGTNVKIYRDTVETIGNALSSVQSNTANVAIGRAGDLASLYFKGIIDEVRIYNKALTSAEISDLYNNYGFSTTAYPGRVLVRKFSSPEPTTSVGNERLALSGASFLFNLV